MIKFERITAKNFISFEELELEFTPGKYIITGKNLCSDYSESNGSGKSSVLELLSWVIYKKSNRKELALNNAGNCFGSVSFWIGENNYKIERYLQDKKFGNDIKVFCNDENISARTNPATEEIILKTIGISYDLFTLVCTVMQGLPLNFSMMTPTVRKGIIESIVGFGIWDTKRTQVVNFKSIENEKHKQVETNYIIKKEDMIAKNSEIETIASMSSNTNQQIKEDIDILRDKMSSVDTKINEVETFISTNFPDISSINEDIMNARLNKIRVDDRKCKLKHILDNKECPECKREYPEQMLADAQAEYNAMLVKLANLDAIQAELKEITTKYNEQNATLTELASQKREYNATLSTITKMVTDNVEDNKNKLDELKVILAALREEVNIFNSEILVIKKRIEYANYIDGLLLPSSKFRTRVLSNYIDYLNTILSEISTTIFNDFSVNLKISDNGAGVDLDIKGNLDRSYQSFSGGEKRRMDIILLLAIQRLLVEVSGVSTNTIMFDEIFDGLDNKGFEMVLNSIDSVFSEDMCIYIVTHRESIKGTIGNYISVIKEEGVSRLEVAFP